MSFEIEDKDVTIFQKFTGLRNNVGPESFTPGDLATATNVDITDEFRIRRRKGFTEALAGSYRSLWSNGSSCLIMSGGTLYEFNEDNTVAILRTGLSTSLDMAYCAVADRVYFSNSVETGVFTGGACREWGIRPPIRQPNAVQIGGVLRAGSYQYAMTYERSDGSESGTGLAGTITLTESAGIGFNKIPFPTDPTITHRNIYISPFDGEKLFRQIRIGVVETAAIYTIEKIGSLPLTTQHLNCAPPGQLLAYFKGVMYVASGSHLFASEPYAPELFDLRRNFPFDSEIKLLAPVNDGLFLGTETEIMFLTGSSTDQLQANHKAAARAIYGTTVTTDSTSIGGDGQGAVVFFATNDGICYGPDGGTIVNVTKSKYVFPATERGAGITRLHGGMMQYLAVLQGAGSNISAAF